MNGALPLPGAVGPRFTETRSTGAFETIDGAIGWCLSLIDPEHGEGHVALSVAKSTVILPHDCIDAGSDDICEGCGNTVKDAWTATVITSRTIPEVKS